MNKSKFESLKDYVLNHPYITLLVVALAVHMVLPLNWGDDKIFRSSAMVTFAQFMQGKARPMTDGLTYIFSRWNFLWRIINPFILTLLAKVLTDLVPAANKKLKALIFCTLPLYPVMIIVDAGFVATNVNYLWPITFAFVNILVFQKLYNKEKFRFYYLLSLPLLLYALNMEMMTVVLSFVFIFGMIVMLIKKRFHFFALIQAVLSVSGALTAYSRNLNGDNSRMIREIGRYFPDFQSLNLFNKIELGFSSTFYCMTMKLGFASVAFIALTAFLTFVVFKANKSTAIKICSLFPCVFSTVFSIISVTPLKNYGFVTFFTGGMQHYKMNKAVYSFEIVPDIIFILIAVCVLATIAFLIKDKADVLKAYLILAVGLGSRMIMGFSPTVWASGYRTFAIFIITMIIVAVMIADRYWQSQQEITVEISKSEVKQV